MTHWSTGFVLGHDCGRWIVTSVDVILKDLVRDRAVVIQVRVGGIELVDAQMESGRVSDKCIANN